MRFGNEMWYCEHHRSNAHYNGTWKQNKFFTPSRQEVKLKYFDLYLALLIDIKKVKFSCYRPIVAQRVGTGIALLFHDRGTRSARVVSGTPRPHFTLGQDPVPILQEAGCASRPVWTGGKPRPHRDSIPYLSACCQSLY